MIIDMKPTKVRVENGRKIVFVFLRGAAFNELSPDGFIHISVSPNSHCVCVWHTGSPCCLHWHCVCVCFVPVRGCEKSREKEASLPSGTDMGLI